MAPARNIALLGSTGSIGTLTIDIVERLGPGRARVVALAARGTNAPRLLDQIRRTDARWVAVTDPGGARDLDAALGGTRPAPHVWQGEAAMEHVATLPEVDTVVVAVAGAAALRATIAAARAGKRLCIATKEVLVAAGALVAEAAREGGAEILPIDSEHSAIFQCIQGYARGDISRIFLTASGGPFRTWTVERIRDATPADALNHPTWRMGGKISVDSATLMNKGLEILEATALFGVPLDRVEVVVHPQSVVHSLVEMRDGALLAQLGLPDMRLPIQIALLHPDKIDTGLPRLRPAEMGTLTFEPPDHARFPALALARRAGERGGVAPAVLNAANEAAVAAFLAGRIGFGAICAVVEAALTLCTAPGAAGTTVAADGETPDLDAVLLADARARLTVEERVAAMTVGGGSDAFAAAAASPAREGTGRE
jgi:1-deoxy-D-xylulose-5-phosphate reductoisomerase